MNDFHNLGPCGVEHRPADRLTITRFRDGTEAHACPHETEEYERWAKAAGCTDIDEYAFQHDVCHVIYGLMRGGVSPALWGVAHGQPVSEEEAQVEEAAVQEIHRFFNRCRLEMSCGALAEVYGADENYGWLGDVKLEVE